jgi:dipeptidyl aminopeptidase/acylaminoacyl peptidase
VKTKKSTTLRQITNSTTEAFKAYKWRTEVITFKAQDGTNVNARLYKPELANANKAAILCSWRWLFAKCHNYWLP